MATCHRTEHRPHANRRAAAAQLAQRQRRRRGPHSPVRRGHSLSLILTHPRVLRLALTVLARYATSMQRSACGRGATNIGEGLGGATPTAHARREA
jgi:hypothetical protein